MAGDNNNQVVVVGSQSRNQPPRLFYARFAQHLDADRIPFDNASRRERSLQFVQQAGVRDESAAESVTVESVDLVDGSSCRTSLSSLAANDWLAFRFPTTSS